MKKTGLFPLLLMLVGLFAASCKSEFEKTRISGDLPRIQKTADTYYGKKNWQRAQSLYEILLPSLKGSSKAEDVYYKYAWTHYQLNQYILGNYYFANFANTFTNSPLREECQFMAAKCHYNLAPTYRLEQGYSEKAMDDFQIFVNTFPNSSRIGECNKLIDDLRRRLEKKAYEEGELYYKLKQYQSALLSFDNLLKDFPESPDVERTRYLAVKSAYLLAENSVIAKKTERYQLTIDKTAQFLNKHAASKLAKEVRSIQESSSQQLKSFGK